MSTKIASLYAEIGADTSKFEAAGKKTKTALDQQAQAFAKFSADATRNAQSFVAYEKQKAKALADTERALVKEAREAERAAKAAAKAAEIQRRNSLVIAPGLEKGTKSITEFASANAALIGVLVGVGVAAGKAFGEFQKYAGEVRDLAIASGTSAEQSSRLLQVLDDFGVTADDVTAATRAMKEKGLVPTVDTLAKLSDQFLAIEDPAERLNFAQDNLGKSASKYYNVLSQGSKAILANSAAVSKSLILTDKQIKDAERQRLAVDAVGDAWQGFKISVGAAVGNVILLNDDMEKAKQILRDNGVAIGGNVYQTQEFKDALAQVRAEQDAVNAVTADSVTETENAMEAEKAREEALKNLSRAFEGLLSSMFTIQDANEQYNDKIEDLNRSDQELVNKKFDLELAFKREQAAGKATAESFSEYIHNLAEVNQAIDENIIKRDEAAKDLEKQSAQRIFDLAQERLGADGLIDAGEFEYLQTLAVQKGLVSQAAADQAIAESRAADDIVNSYNNQTDAAGDSAREIIDWYEAINDAQMTTLELNNAIAESFGNTVPATSPLPTNGRPGEGRDTGGPGFAGKPYMVGTKEIFVPETNGTFVPLGGATGKDVGSKTVNIYLGAIYSQDGVDYLAQEVLKAMTSL